MNMVRNTLATALVAAGLLAANTASALERWVDLHNAADAAIVAVQISDIDMTDWGPNILGSTIPAGYVGQVEPSDTRGYCRFDVRLTYADGTASAIYDVNLCEALDLVTDGYSYRVTTV